MTRMTARFSVVDEQETVTLVETDETYLSPAHRWLLTMLLVVLVIVQVVILAGCNTLTPTEAALLRSE